jgi:8-oxo-dGTP diphosphatase
MSNHAETQQPTPATKKYFVVGFMLDPTLMKVVLIRKTKPDYQRGLLNGVGGKIGDTIAGESAEDAIVREFEEETGVVGLSWRKFMHLDTPLSDLTFFYAIGNVHAVQTMTEEQVGVFDIDDVMNRCDTMPNIRWCIQMARAFEFGEHAEWFENKEIIQPQHVREAPSTTCRYCKAKEAGQ